MLQHHRHCTGRRHTSQPSRWSTPVHKHTPRYSSRCTPHSTDRSQPRTSLQDTDHCMLPMSARQWRRTDPRCSSCTRPTRSHCTCPRDMATPWRTSTPPHRSTPRCSCRCSPRSSCPTHRRTDPHCSPCRRPRHPHCTDPADTRPRWRWWIPPHRSTPHYTNHCTMTTPSRSRLRMSLQDTEPCMRPTSGLWCRRTDQCCSWCRRPHRPH
jgi:hypothetical protein